MSSPSDRPTQPPKTITLKTADDNYFDVDQSVAMEFVTVKTYFDDNTDTQENVVVPLPNVSAKYLSLIIQYCKEQLKFREESTREAEKKEREAKRKEYEAKFVEEMSNDDLKEMILAVNYLNIKPCLEMLNQAVAERIKNKSVEYVRNFFGIESDWTPEEEARMREENAWVYENVED